MLPSLTISSSTRSILSTGTGRTPKSAVTAVHPIALQYQVDHQAQAQLGMLARQVEQRAAHVHCGVQARTLEHLHATGQVAGIFAANFPGSEGLHEIVRVDIA